MFHSRYSLVRS